MIDNLAEAIAHAREVAKNWESQLVNCVSEEGRKMCKERAENSEQIAAWLEELAKRREADRWISVKDKLPDKAKKYLVQTEYDIVTLAFFEGDYFVRLNGGKLCVKYWRPLPKPYESEDK